MHNDISTNWRGLSVSGSVDHDPGVWSWSNGDPGYPPCTDIDVQAVDLAGEEEPEAFVEILDYVGPAAYRIACGASRVLGRLPHSVADWFLDRYAEELSGALHDESQGEPWFDEDRDREDD